MTEESTHTEDCQQLDDRLSKGVGRVTVASLSPAEQEIIFSCPHWAHEIPKQMFHR